MKCLIVLVLVIAVAKSDLGILKEYTAGNLKFSANVYKELLKTNSGNFLVCPMSVETVFALITAGAKGETSSQILTGFSFPNDVDKLQKIFKELSPKLQYTGNYNLSSANKIYLKNGFKIKEEFQNVAKTVYDAGIQEIDFTRKAAAAKEINEWVEEKTFNKIKDLLSKEDIGDLTKMVIVNAMYFKGNWYHEFAKHQTKKRNFFLDLEKTVEVDTMDTTNYFLYHESEDTNAKYLEMDFHGSDVTMTIILPNAKDGLARLEEQLEKVIDVPNYSAEKVHVRLPKFEMGSKIEFQTILANLGVTTAFTDFADFSGITNGPAIKIDAVLQKTFINVEEEGTTAAAATAVLFAPIRASIGPPPKPPKEFFADHPFIYLLRNQHGIMFIGRYVSNDN